MVRPAVPQVLSPLSWKTGIGSRIKPQHFRETVHWHAPLLRNTQVYGTRWEPPQGTKGTGECAHWDTFYHFPAVLVNLECPRWLEIGTCDGCLQKDQKEDWGNCRSVSLTSVSGKIMQQIILDAIMQGIQDNQGIRQLGLGKAAAPWEPDLLPWQDLVNGGKAVYVVCLDFSKAFDIISYNILLDKLSAHGLDSGTIGWVKNCVWLGPWGGAEWSYIRLGRSLVELLRAQYCSD